jgi:hypothetical protein
MNKKTKKIKAGAFAVAILFLAMTAAATVNATRGSVMPIPGGQMEMIPHQSESSSQIMGDPDPGPPTQFHDGTISPLPFGSTPTLGYPDDPNGQDDPYPPPGQRCSYMFLTGIYDMYNDSLKLVGLSFNIWMNPRGGTHNANWYPGNYYMTLEGDHAGTYSGEFYWFNTFSGTPGWFGISFQDIWDPVHDRITYFHLWADYTEDGQHIRYIDRTFQQDWNNNNG